MFGLLLAGCGGMLIWYGFHSQDWFAGFVGGFLVLVVALFCWAHMRREWSYRDAERQHRKARAELIENYYDKHIGNRDD